MEKRKLFNNYIRALKREGIVFTSYSDNYTLNINMGDRIISAYASKNWWRDPKGGVTGNGAMSLVKHICAEINKKSAIDAEIELRANYKAAQIIQKEYDNRSFIGKLFTKKNFEKAIKELMK